MKFDEEYDRESVDQCRHFSVEFPYKHLARPNRTFKHSSVMRSVWALTNKTQDAELELNRLDLFGLTSRTQVSFPAGKDIL
jgi:hypothetical protein